MRVYLQDVYTVFTFKRKLYILNRNSFICFQEKSGNTLAIHVQKIVGSAKVLSGNFLTGYRYETEAFKAGVPTVNCQIEMCFCELCVCD